MRKTETKKIVSPMGRLSRGLISLLLLIYTSITILVLLSTLLNAFKTKSDLIRNMFGWPQPFTLESFITVILEDKFLIYFRNSIIVTGLGTTFCIILSAMVAYGIARYEFRGKTFLTSYFLLGMMFPIQISILPLFLIMKRMQLINTLTGMILIYAAGMSLPVLIFQKFFRTIPMTLDESARIDGAGDIKIFVRIILPLCKPVISTLALITAVMQWNSFYMPMVFLGKRQKYTLTLGIYKYLSNFIKYMNVSFAAVVITLIPVVVLYFLFNKQIVEGLTGGAVKG